MRKVIEEIKANMDTKEVVMSLILTVILLFVSFVGSTKLVLEPITVRNFTTDVYITYYGFPLGIMGILTPVTNLQNQIVSAYTLREGHPRVQVLWAGLIIDFATYFTLTFFMIFLFQKYIIARKEDARVLEKC